ncbi:ABC transporter permease [Rhodococcus sp. IEGM1428]|uniref:ABC transporter permease n=1 Tax=Rhodococcus sp. IEGM1428 TaxID=3392191 RepID=UPI003D09AA96
MAQVLSGRKKSKLRASAGSFDSVTIAAGLVLGLAVVLAVFGPALAPYDPSTIDLSNALAGSSWEHWLGTDQTGRDILSRLLYGARPTLLAPLIVVIIATAVGAALAISAAWTGGWYDSLVSRVLDILFAFPGLILAILAVAIFGTGLAAPVVALSVTYVPVVARVLRSAALRESNLPYIDALYVQGAGTFSICLKHLLPNLAPLIMVQATIAFGYALLDLAAISYLGLGQQPPSSDWGLMISDGQSSILGGHLEQSLYASILVVVVVVSVNLIGDRVAQHFEVEQA